MEVYTVRISQKSGDSVSLAEIFIPILVNGEGKKMEVPSWRNHCFVKLPKYCIKDSRIDEKQAQLDSYLEFELRILKVSDKPIIS
jgi:hypothetical protein